MFVAPTNIMVQNFPRMFSGSLAAYSVTFRIRSGKLTTLIATSPKNLSRIIQSFSSEDEAAPASERDSALIAAFIEDQLAVRPPITQGEVDDLKRRLRRPDR